MKDNVPMEVKKERLQRLNALVNKLAIEKNNRYKGQIVEVLVDGESKIIQKYLQVILVQINL